MDIKIHDVVEVDLELSQNHLIEHDFIGTVIYLYENGHTAMVEDQDNNVYDVEIKSLKGVSSV